MTLRAVLLAVLVAGCAPAIRPSLPSTALPDASAGLCRVGADGGIPLAERGIGGTGSPVQVAERGIGGTGAPAGIGGTGIVGVITGFASVCLAGQEVEYGPGLPILVDGRPAGLDALRAGQVAVVVADGARPVASRLSVRHEVSGPVERTEPDGALRVAGQLVVLPPRTAVPAPGSWVEVSGFRRSDGTLDATRIDPRGAGEVLLRGIMRSERGQLWIGLVEVRPGPGQFRQSGVPVLAIGHLNDGVLQADTVEPDGLLVDPVAFFGPAVGVLVLEGYAEGGFVRFGSGLRSGVSTGTGRALARFERAPGGQFAPAATRAGGAMPRPGAGSGPAPRAGFEPAPTPNRTMERAAGRGGERGGFNGGGGFRGGRRGNEAQGEARPGGEGGGGAGFGGFGGGQGGGGGFRGPPR